MSRRNAPRGTGPPPGQKVLYPIHDGVQRMFMETDAEEVLYGGAASGGKSHALRAIGVSYCLLNPGAVVVLFRRTFRELEDTHILRLQMELPTYIASYKASQHDFIFENGSILMLRFCEKEEDVRTYDTFEADMMLFDELTAFSEFQYVYLTTRCRSTKAWWKGPKIMSATNPGNVGHLWVKKRWVDFAKPFEKKRAPITQGGMIRQFIPAKVADNPTLMKRDPGYVNRLQGLPEEEKRAKLFGDWGVFSGQFFQRWREEVHLYNTFDTPPAEWLRYMFVDWGLAVPHAVLWAARPPGTNFIWLYREQYGAGVPTREQARLAAQKVRASGEKIEYIICDPAMFAKEKDAEGDYMASVADIWKDEFAGTTEVIRGNNERVQGWSVVRECLDWQGIETPSGTTVLVPPRIRIHKTNCPNLARTLPALVHSKNNPEDVNTDSEDHASDALRYGVRHLFGAPDRGSKVRWLDTPTGIVAVGV